MDMKEEVARLMEEMEITIAELEDSEFYQKVRDELNTNQSLRNNIFRIMGTDSTIEMVIYALGSIEHYYQSQYQLALAILLKRDFPQLIESMEAYDPVTSATDKIVMKKLGCNVLSHNEYCRRRVERPMLFLMPKACIEHVGNLLDENWCPSRINRMILLTNSFRFAVEDDYWGEIDEEETEMNVIVNGVRERLHYMEAILNYTTEFSTDNSIPRGRNPFCMLNWHFFDVPPSVDMENLLPEYPSKEKRLEMRLSREEDEKLYEEGMREGDLAALCKEIADYPFGDYPDIQSECRKDWSFYYNTYRCPSRPRNIWCAPCAGWIKLNFGGIESDGANKGGYGVVFHNEHGKCLASCVGPLKDANSTFANVEALRYGTRYLQCHMSWVSKLIIEGHDLSVIRWANRLTVPPKHLIEAFQEIRNGLEIFECVILHIYKEANLDAVQLAEEGALMLEPTSRTYDSK